LKFKRQLLKKKTVIIGATLFTIPFLLGFTNDNGNAPTENKVESNVQTSDKTVDAPFDKKSDESKPAAEVNQSAEGEENKTPPPPRKVEYNQNRESDAVIRDFSKQFNGKTVVKIEFEGASPSTLPAVQSAVLMHEGDEFNADAATRDIDAIRDIGYFYDAYQTFSEVPEGVMITYHMLENPVLNEIVIEGNTIYTTEELLKGMNVKRGFVLNSKTLHGDITAILEKYHDDGYIWMRLYDMGVTPEGVVTLQINEGTLEGYQVKGNEKTKDYVILREMRQKTGQPFNAKLARRSMERVYNLGFFEDVNMKMLPGVEPNAIIMEVNVQEKRTGTFGVGAGYSTSEGLVGSVVVTDTNFRGTGDAVSISYEKSANEHDAHGFSFSYRHPWIDSKETAGTLRIYHRTYQYYDYDTQGDLKERYMRRYVGGEITLSRPFSEYSTNFLTLRQRKDTYVRHVRSGNAGDRSGAEGEQWRNDNFGTTRSIGFQHVTDTRDNIYNPTRGDRASVDVELGGLLGGDFKYQKVSVENQHFFKAGNHDQVWAWRGSYGVGRGDMTEFNQFRVGGQDSLRGYRDNQFRGNRMFLATLEYRFPLAKKFQGIIFTDWGGAWNSNFLPKGGDIYGSIGLGLAVNTPLGPLRLDYGRGKQGGRFHFNIGGSF